MKQNAGTRSLARWSSPLILGVIGLVCLLAFSEHAAVGPPAAVARRSLGIANGDVSPERASTGAAGARRRPGAVPEESLLDAGSSAHLGKLDALLLHAKTMTTITPGGARYIARMLRDLQKKGSAAVPAIGDLLRRGTDVDFARMKGGELVGHRTLRQALIDTLGEIGGSQAVAVSLEQVQRTTEPMEIVMLARNLDWEEPGRHRQPVLDAVGNGLESAARASAQESPDVAPLFDLLRTYGDEQSVGLLERSVPEWEEYALIALGTLPDGTGIPSLVALAQGDTSIADPVLPFQILAQAAVQYSEAGDALVELARAGHIPDEDWRAMGEALEGKHLEFPAKMFDGTPLGEGITTSDGRLSPWKSYFIEWLNVHYEQKVVSADWSEEQVDRQLALIDDLRDSTTSPAAVRALDQARAALQRRRGRDEGPIPQG